MRWCHPPRYIEMVGQLGYRFLEEGTGTDTDLAAKAVSPEDAPVVGRDQELQHLQRWFTTTVGGVRQVVFVTGEPGIGKTTLVDLFLDRVRAMGRSCAWSC